MQEKKSLTCDCGWNVTSPHGEQDVLKHAKIHVQEKHPEMKLTEKELQQMIKPA